MIRSVLIHCTIIGLADTGSIRIEIEQTDSDKSQIHIKHAHSHAHGGQHHIHWHSHALEANQERVDTDGDHHDQVDAEDNEDVPMIPPESTTSIRDENRKLGSIDVANAILIKSALPTLRPPTPPPKSVHNDENLSQLRTVILLT